MEIHAYSDSDWAGCAVIRKSTTGVLLQMYGCSIIHYSRTQSTIAQSSAEAELYALTSASNELILVQSVVMELGLASSSSNVKLSLCSHRLSKWQSNDSETRDQQKVKTHPTQVPSVKVLHLQELVEQGIITLHKVSSQLNPSDILTKFMPQVTSTR
eukprot:5391999-Amphidinium_carterae.1